MGWSQDLQVISGGIELKVQFLEGTLGFEGKKRDKEREPCDRNRIKLYLSYCKFYEFKQLLPSVGVTVIQAVSHKT